LISPSRQCLDGPDSPGVASGACLLLRQIHTLTRHLARFGHGGLRTLLALLALAVVLPLLAAGGFVVHAWGHAVPAPLFQAPTQHAKGVK